MNYTVLSERTSATFVCIKKAGKQLITTNGQCFITTFEERKRKISRQEHEPVCSQMAAWMLPGSGPNSPEFESCSLFVRHRFATQSSFFKCNTEIRVYQNLSKDVVNNVCIWTHKDIYLLFIIHISIIYIKIYIL